MTPSGLRASKDLKDQEVIQVLQAPMDQLDLEESKVFLEWREIGVPGVTEVHEDPLAPGVTVVWRVSVELRVQPADPASRAHRALLDLLATWATPDSRA